MDAKIEELLKQMTLEEKVSLCSGADAWHTRAIERLGIPAIRMTDGPHGVRRPYDDDHGSWPATSFPTASAMAATWNVGLTRRVGEALAEETKTKGCDILLGPAVNIHRAPMCGRNFEYYSEDPYLAGRMAVAYIQGLQSRGVGASLKHYAANNAEFERFTISSDVDERTLHEIYLHAFQMAVEEAQPWTVMCAYNKINGTWASEHRYLLTDILREAWGFQGFVVSDWGAVHNRILSSNAGLDLEMPGIGEMPIEIVVNAVQSGLIAEETIDEMVRRILRVVFMARGNAPERKLVPEAADTPEHRNLAREAAEESIVLLKNQGGLLPFDENNGRSQVSVRKIAVFGPSAAVARIQGGGSAQVTPYYTVTPLDGIKRLAGSGIEVMYTQGVKNQQLTPPTLNNEHVRATSGAPGFQGEYFAGKEFAGQPILTRVDEALDFSRSSMPAEETRQSGLSARWMGTFNAPVSGEYVFSLSSAGQSRLLINGEQVVDHWNDPNLGAFMSVWPWQSKRGTVHLENGKSYEVVVEYLSYPGGYRLHAGYELPLPEDEMDRVTRMAAEADAAIVVVGTTHEHETEGYDRKEWELPGDQVKLINTVAVANPRTIVVLINGTPLDIATWEASVPAIVEGWFNGQETGNALASVLFGHTNPSGKLPDTYPVRYKDNPSYLNYPGESGHLLYGEGIFVGYRYYDAKEIEPLYPFGHGLSYTTFSYENLRLSGSEMEQDGTLEVAVDVRNTGTRTGKEVVQLYVSDTASRLVRPPKELKGFQKISLEPGQMETVRFTLTKKDLSYYDPAQKAWVAEAGAFNVLIGSSSRDIRAQAAFTLKPGPQAPQPRLHGETSLSAILNDPQGRKVLEKHLPQIMGRPEVEQYAEHINLNRMGITFMEILPPQTLKEVLEELAQIA